MKSILTILTTILILTSCKKDILIIQANRTADNLAIETTIENPAKQKVGFVFDSSWFKTKFPNYWIETHNEWGEADFNKDGIKDIVIMFATNASNKYLFQKDTSSRVVVGVFINRKTYFELDTNLVYSYLGGYSDVFVSDINNDGYFDFYQSTGYWEGTQYPKPSYYNNSGWGGMDSYVFINNKNKGFTRYTIPIGDDAPSTTAVIFDNNKNGYKEIYLASCQCYFEFNGNGFNKVSLFLDKSFGNQTYPMAVLTPKIADEKLGVIYTAESIWGELGFILKVDGNRIIPITKFKPAYPQSGPAQEIIPIDLDKDGKTEWIMPMEISSNSNNTKPAVPYLMILDENGNDISLKYMDEEITKPLTYDQINWVGETWQTGFIYHTFADIDNDGIVEIFPASGVGYKKGNDTYYYKFIQGKFRLNLYHTGWFGDVHKSKGYISYKPVVDEKNKTLVFRVIEGDLSKSIFKTF